MVLEKIKTILSEQFGVDEESISEKTNIEKDLGADSLDMADLLIAFEEEFDIDIEENDDNMEKIKTVKELTLYIKKKLNNTVI